MTAADDQDRREVSAVIERRDERAFRSLYARHTPVLFGMALRLVDGSQHDAEDVVQETWLRAVQKLKDFTWRSSLRTWLTGIVINCCRERWRDSPPDTTSEIHDSTGAGADDEALAMVTRVDLERALASLHPGYRAVLLLHDVEGWTHASIAKQLGIAEGTAKSQLFHARFAMRRTLASAVPATPSDL